MDGYQYEKKCAELLKTEGFSNVEVTPKSGDQGIDVIAYRSKKKYGVQCKYYEGTVGNKAIQEVYAGAAYYNCDVVLVITNSTLTKSAKELARKLKVEIWENIDAIYLQKHTAEYIEQEKELRRKEEERKQQLERQWKQEQERKREIALKEQKAHKERQKEEAKKVAKLRPRYDYASRLIASSWSHTVVVKPDGTVVAEGYNSFGECNVSRWRNVVSVQCSLNGTVGVTSAGRVYYTGTTLKNQFQCCYWTGIKEAGFVGEDVVGLKYDGTVVTTGNIPSITTWHGISQLRFSENRVVGITTDKKLVPIYLLDGEQNNVDDAAMDHDGEVFLLKEDGSVSVCGSGRETPRGLLWLNKQYGIVKICMISGIRPAAILGDGSISFEPHNNIYTDEFCRFLADNEIKKVAAICDHAILTENGKVYQFDGHPVQPFGADFRLFSDFHKMMDEKERRDDRRDKELCQHCGGSFKKTLFGMKCTSCGRKKDY